MSGGELFFAAVALIASSGCWPYLATPGSRLADRLSAAIAVLASLLGLAVAISALLGASGAETPRHELRIDSLSAAFLVPLFLLSAAAAVYAVGYWPADRHPRSARRLRLFVGLLVGAMAVVFTARHGIVFLFAWETMALSAFFLITAEDRDDAGRTAGWVYLVATHTGTLALFLHFVAWRAATGSFAWTEPARGAITPVAASLLFALAVIGFGFKAGLFPLHFWLPGAHAQAPSHVSALLSGVMLKAGIYGVLRAASFLPIPFAAWGILLLVAGVVSATFGIALAFAQRDAKRLLAFSSIENVGVVFVAFGLALIGRGLGRADLEAAGLLAALLHVWNHAIFKGLLFLGIGAVGRRDLERLGGIATQMPGVAAALVLGALAACALPPMNGFASEWLLYLGLGATLSASGPMPMLALAIPALAAVGALAIATFVKLIGAALLGAPRAAPELAEPTPSTVLIPLALLAAAGLLAGLFPLGLAVALAPAARCFDSTLAAPALQLAAEPLVSLTAIGLGVLTLLAVIALPLGRVLRTPRTQPTWDCGFARPAPSMQYGARSIAEWFSERLVPRSLRPVANIVILHDRLAEPARFAAIDVEPVGERALVPWVARWAERFARIRRLEQGRLPVHLLYIFATVLVLLAWSSLRGLLRI